MRKVQIGVIGSMLDKNLDASIKEISREVGEQIAKNNAILVFGFEGDFDSLSLIAAKSAEKAGGKTIAFLWGNEKQDFKGLNSLQIVTGQNRGGGREFPFILSCDALICISGGSGTLMEIAMAYQGGIPTIALRNSEGWSQKLANRFLDDRKRQKIIGVKTAKEAVVMALKLARKI